MQLVIQFNGEAISGLWVQRGPVDEAHNDEWLWDGSRLTHINSGRFTEVPAGEDIAERLIHWEGAR